MKIYKAKSLFTSSGIDYVAVPAHKVDIGLIIQYEGKFMKLTEENWTPAWYYTVKDKYGRGTYELVYYPWEGKELWEMS